jgi:hypothetical protein
MSMPKVQNTSFDNFAGIAQVYGTLGPFSWFFRARGRSWTFHLVEDAQREARCADPMPDDYWEEGELASVHSLSNDDVNAFVDQCLQRYWESRGKRTFYRHA